VDGEPLDTLLVGKRNPDRQERFLMHYPHAPHRSDYFTVYRDGDWKVIYHYYPSPQSDGSHYQLFNLAEDPFESTNLAEKRPEKLREMGTGLIESLEQHHAQYPLEKGTDQPRKPKLP
jgi:arylsulfatase A-like enzyme